MFAKNNECRTRSEQRPLKRHFGHAHDKSLGVQNLFCRRQNSTSLEKVISKESVIGRGVVGTRIMGRALSVSFVQAVAIPVAEKSSAPSFIVLVAFSVQSLNRR